MSAIFFILGGVFGICMYIYIPKWVSRFFEVLNKEYEVKFTLMYFYHPTETSKKGEYVRMKPIVIRINAIDEEEASKFASEVVHENLKVEIDSVEEVVKNG